MFLSCGVRSSGSTRRFFLTSYPGDAYGLNAHRFAFRVRPGYAARRSYVSRDVPPRRAWFECDPGESRCARPDHVSWFVPGTRGRGRGAGTGPVENLNAIPIRVGQYTRRATAPANRTCCIETFDSALAHTMLMECACFILAAHTGRLWGHSGTSMGM